MRSTAKFLVVLASVGLALVPSLCAQRLDLVLHRDGVIHDTLVEKGTYRIEVAPSLDSVSFFRGSRLVVSAPCKIGMLTRPVIGNSISYGRLDDGREKILKIELLSSQFVIDFAD